MLVKSKNFKSNMDVPLILTGNKYLMSYVLCQVAAKPEDSRYTTTTAQNSSSRWVTFIPLTVVKKYMYIRSDIFKAVFLSAIRILQDLFELWSTGWRFAHHSQSSRLGFSFVIDIYRKLVVQAFINFPFMQY